MIFILFALLSMPIAKAQTPLSIPIYVFEFKPVIYKDEKKEIQGTWFNSFQKLSEKSGVKFNYQFVSIPRMELMLSGSKPGCNLTLFRSKKREAAINFIFDHKEPVMLKAYQRSSDPRVWNFKNIQEMQQSKKIKIITNSSVAIDLLAEKDIKIDLFFDINSIINMLMKNRIDVYVGTNLAVESRDEYKTSKIKSGLVIKSLIRGIGCSRGTPVEITDRIQKATKTWTLEAS